MAKECCKSKPRCASEPFLFLYSVSFGANVSLFPQLVISKLCQQNYNSTVCGSLASKQFKAEENIVYEQAATWNTIIFASVYIPSLFTVLPIGALADVISKRKILFLPSITIILQSIIYICCARYKSTHIWFIAFATGLTSIYGDIEGVISFSSTYLACVTDKGSERTLRLAFLEGCIYLGWGIGSFIAGVLLRYYSFTLAFSLSISAGLTNVMFVTFFLQEPENSKEKEWEEEEFDSTGTILKLCCQSLRNIKKSTANVVCFAKKYFCSAAGRSIVLLFVATFFTVAAAFGEVVVATIFLKHSPLSLSASAIGVYYFTLNTIRGTGVCFLVYITTKLFDPSDFTVITVGLTSTLAAHISIAFSTTKQMLFGFTVLSLASPYGMAGLSAHLTKIVKEQEYGTVLSFIAFIDLLSVTVMTCGADALFQATAPFFPGFSFLLLAFSSFIALIMVVFVFCFMKKTVEIEQIGSVESKE